MKSQGQIDNLRLLRSCWIERIKPQQVCLRAWAYEPTLECGALACLGGWVALIPEFQAQGVKRSPLGAPFMSDGWIGALGPDHVARILFDASPHFFSGAGIYEKFNRLLLHGNDWELALARIDHELGSAA